MLDTAQKLFEDYGDFPSLRKMSLSRIDFCSNIRMKDQETAEEYIDLLKRGYLPKGYELDQYYDKKAKRKKPYENSVKYIGTNGVTM